MYLINNFIECYKCLQVLEYNVPHGKKNRGMFVLMSYTHLVKDAAAEDLKIARILGWCIELVKHIINTIWYLLYTTVV